MVITPATIHFDGTGTPISQQFGDFYFSTDDGWQEALYVFVQSNGLPQRWLQPSTIGMQDHFVIAETGFGSGLNFLATWDQFRQFRSRHPQQSHPSAIKRLHFISIEKYPLSLADLSQALAHWPVAQPLSQLLIKQYPPLLPGCHRLVFDQGTVILDLWFGDVQQILPQLFPGQSGIVNAWYLDGFAPSKNTDMWCPAVFQQLRTLAQLNCTIATFTSAKVVKQGLTDVGFTLRKISGFGKKREMLTGILLEKPAINILPPFYFRHPNTAHAGKQIAIIGGGIAAAQLCYSLAKRGYEITLYCKDHRLAQGASQNRQGALYPLLQAKFDNLSEFYGQAYGFAVQQYQQLRNQGFAFEHQFCGVMLLGVDDKTRQRQQSLIDSQLWSPQLVNLVDSAQASAIAQLDLPYGGLYFPDGGWINPATLIDALIKAAQQLTTVKVQLNSLVSELQQTKDQQWQLNVNDQQHTFANAVICCGHLANQFSQTQGLGLSPIRGQVSHLAAIAPTEKLATVLCYNGYITPALAGHHCIGASFIKDDISTELRTIEHVNNLKRLAEGIGQPTWLKQLTVPEQGKAAIRCSSIDHLPLVGAVPDETAYQQTYQYLWKGLRPRCYDLPPDYANLFIFTALGARGLCSAPLCAEILAAQIDNEPYPACQRILAALNPGRGYIKTLKAKNQP